MQSADAVAAQLLPRRITAYTSRDEAAYTEPRPRPLPLPPSRCSPTSFSPNTSTYAEPHHAARAHNNKKKKQVSQTGRQEINQPCTINASGS